MARLRYIAFLTENPEELSNFYARHLNLDKLGRSNAGVVWHQGILQFLDRSNHGEPNYLPVQVPIV